MNALEQIVIQNGFASLKEFNHLVASIDLSNLEKLAAFEQWRDNDGTKEGLLKLIPNRPGA
jgi:hypothetical protein